MKKKEENIEFVMQTTIPMMQNSYVVKNIEINILKFM